MLITVLLSTRDKSEIERLSDIHNTCFNRYRGWMSKIAKGLINEVVPPNNKTDAWLLFKLMHRSKI